MTEAEQFERPRWNPAPGRERRILNGWLGLFEAAALSVCCMGVLGSGCSKPIPEDALVLTEVPRSIQPASCRDELDVHYPAGTRIVLVSGSDGKLIRVLSGDLFAAGEPVVAHNGKRIVFAGKSSPDALWQIYEANRDHGGMKALTSVKGGAKDPALLGDGTLIYVSPVAALSPNNSPTIAQLYAQSAAAPVRQLTFASTSVADPTVLSDGRIMFVTSGPNKSSTNTALYTINNDGTEITAFAGQHDAVGPLRHPRELPNHRVAFLTGPLAPLPITAQIVSTARPFTSRTPLLPNAKAAVSCVEPRADGDWILCARRDCDSPKSSGYSVFRVSPAAGALANPVFTDPAWDVYEAAPLHARPRPMGRISSVEPNHPTGQILCLNINDTTVPGSGTAKRVRILSRSSSARFEQVLGEIEVQPDGSFMAEVPANVPLGFEALDESGAVLRREPPFVWVRSGENRACIGCHEAHNHSPKNQRPLAARIAIPRLPAGPISLARTVP